MDGLKIIVIFSHKTEGVLELPEFHLFLTLPTPLAKEDRICHFVKNKQAHKQTNNKKKTTMIHLEPQWIQRLILSDIYSGALYFCKNKIPLIKISHLAEDHEKLITWSSLSPALPKGL